MAANQNTLLSVDDFARHVHRDPDDVLRQLHQGEIAGRMIGNTWYVDANALQQAEQVAQPVSLATSVMLAAANLHWREIFHDFHARRSVPLKASTPEFGLDIGMIEAEGHALAIFRAQTARCRLAEQVLIRAVLERAREWMIHDRPEIAEIKIGRI